MSKTLLLADDSVVIQKLVGLSFANEDLELVSTDNGDDAVLKAREIRPDVVLADVVMPGKSGYEVCEAIKQDPALAHVPVLLLTGTFEAFDEARAASVGADGHITKPFEAQALVERVKNVMKNAARPAPAPQAASQPLAADRLFDEGEILVDPTPARASGRGEDLTTTEGEFLGLADSLDVTPSLSESDLAEGLEDDLFGAPGEIGGPSFGMSAAESPSFQAPSRFDPAPASEAKQSAQATTAISGVEDATLAILPGSDSDVSLGLADDFGFDEPLEVAPLPVTALDLDTAFDPEPAPRTKIQVARDDANAMTSRSLVGAGGVTDLDELLAAPAPPATPMRRVELRPEPPVALDFGPSEQSAGDLEFGFDVSEQAPIAKVDLLEESFSSLLDVSESQLLKDPSATPPSTRPSTPPPAPVPLAPFTPIHASEPAAVSGEFDVSSSDLATSGPLFDDLAPPPLAPPPIPTRAATAAELDLDLFLDVPRAGNEPIRSTPSVADTAAAAASERRAVDDLSPILQQRVQETLEKVAWEAFSDLSETIVKQVIERVERIAWEVIPQMAETLVREEIRKLKGDTD